MKRAFTTSSVILVALLLFVMGCRSGGGDLSRAETQRQFGVRMAKMNLWREAMFRFRRATEIEPANAMAHNNLAVAYEATGDFDAAAREYREALRLDRSNQYIQKNYSRFVEFTQKAKKRDVKPATPSATAAAASDAGTVPVSAPGAPPSAATPPASTPATSAPPSAIPPTAPAPSPVPPATDTATTNPPEEGAR